MEKSKNNILILFLLLFTFTFSLAAQIKDVPVVKLFEKEYYKYDVKPHETIYSICKRFNVTEEEILSMNPFLANGLKSGQTLMIPVRISGTAKEKEISAPNENRVQKKDISSQKQKKSSFTLVSRPRISLLLPFSPNTLSGSNERFIEFYEGFLMAVDSLKSLGLSFEVQALDSGDSTDGIMKAITSGKLRETDYCIGGTTPEQIALLSEWAKENQKILILPFSSRIPELQKNSYLYQTNTPHSLMYDVLAKYCVSQIMSSNIIFLNTPSANNADEGAVIIPQIKNELKKKGIPFLEIEDDEELTSLFNAMVTDRENIIFTPPLSMNLTNSLVTRMAAKMKTYPDKKITLMGYPEWQAMSKSYQKRLYELNTYIFSNFYADMQRSNVRNFQIDFNRDFGKELLNTYPKYGMMGYDIASYFIPRMIFEKSELSESMPMIAPLQNDFLFSTERSENGSYNKLFYIIHYTPDNTVEVQSLK